MWIYPVVNTVIHIHFIIWFTRGSVSVPPGQYPTRCKYCIISPGQVTTLPPNAAIVNWTDHCLSCIQTGRKTWRFTERRLKQSPGHYFSCNMPSWPSSLKGWGGSVCVWWNRTGPNRTGLDRIEMDRNGPNRIELNRTGPDRTEPDWTEPNCTGPDRTELDWTKPNQTESTALHLGVRVTSLLLDRTELHWTELHCSIWFVFIADWSVFISVLIKPWDKTLGQNQSRKQLQ